MRRRRPRIDGLQARLTAWVATVVVVSVGVIFFVVYHETGSRLRAEVERDIRGDATQFEHSLAAAPAGSRAGLLATARAYVRVQPYGEASALLFVLVPGVGTASNHPELFGTASPDDGDTAAQQATENVLGRQLRIPRPGYSTRDVPDVDDVRVYEQRMSTASGPVYVGAGEPLTSVSRSQADVARSFALGGAITLLLVLIASYLVGARVSAPVRRLAALAARVDAGDLEPRAHVDASTPRELRVLSESFNHMLDRLAEAFAVQREFVADASHELRTPLTVIRGQLELLAADPDPSRDEVRRVEQLVQSEIGRIARLVEDLLLLARAERGDFLRIRPIELGPFVEELWEGVALLANRDFELGPVPRATLNADPDRLAQALRNLARNAIEHTGDPDGVVRLETTLTAYGAVRFSINDDGPGIPPAERDRVFQRFHRTDPARSRSDGGAGLGLAIVRAIAEAHHGSARATVSPEGGAQLELELPGAVPAAELRPSGVRLGP